jgi:putative PEP-CTERM system integral membrane protein
MKWLRIAGIFSIHAIFWTWNLNFVAFALFSFPTLWFELFRQTIRGVVPWNLTIFVVALVALPIASLWAGWRFRREPRKLAELFFGLEGPLFLMIIVRLFLVRELTAASGFLLVVFFAAMASLAVELVLGLAADRRVAALQMIGQAALLLAGLYSASVLFFYAVPIGVSVVTGVLGAIPELLRHLWQEIWDVSLWPTYVLSAIYAFVLIVSFTLLFASTFGLFAVMPITLSVVAVRSWRRVFRLYSDREGFLGAWGATAAVTAALVVGFVLSNRTTTPETLAFVREPPADVEGRRAVIAREFEVREALLAAYLAPYRYWGDTQNNDAVKDLWRDELWLPEAQADVVQDMHDALARPMLWQGDLYGDVELAERKYREIFDVPIQKAERDAISAALATTWNQSEAQAGLLDVNSRKVLLERQTITTTIDGDVARVELAEVYLNQTPDQQEVLYYFTLPETAAVTGLWLSDDPEDPEKFVFQVAPRGAAQQVYREQVVERRDPALLEQVGPRQYRLRAFPIPAIPFDPEQEQGRMYLKLTYSALVGDDGEVPFPELFERRNVYWDGSTVRGLNGGAFDAGDDWFPDGPVAPGALGFQPTLYTGTLDGDVLTVVPASSGPKAMPQNRKFAVVVDTSRSMAHALAGLNDAWATVQELDGPSDVDVYVTGADPIRLDEPALFDPMQAVYYGSATPNEMLRQLAEQRRFSAYDAILVLTDAGSYDIAEGGAANPTTAQRFRSRWDDWDGEDVAAPAPKKSEPLPDPGAPVFFVHVGGELPPAYDDAVLEVIQSSRGGVATDLGDVLARLSLWEVEGRDSVLADGRIWRFQAGEAPAAEGVEAPASTVPAAFVPIAARQRIGWVARQQDMTQVASLDSVHATAKAHGVVTAYSSMIVLVDDWQKKRLEQLEKQDDRFDREHETGEERLSGQEAPFASVPEPEEWALIGLAGGLLVFAAIRSRRNPRAAGSW